MPRRSSRSVSIAAVVAPSCCSRRMRGCARCTRSYRERLAYPVRLQGEMPRLYLLEWFRQTPGAVLFATATFWEGIDVVGDALSCVIIDRLPFPSPSDPLVMARVRALEARGPGRLRALHDSGRDGAPQAGLRAAHPQPRRSRARRAARRSRRLDALRRHDPRDVAARHTDRRTSTTWSRSSAASSRYYSSCVTSLFARACSSLTTVESASVVVSPSVRPSAMSRRRRRMILPLRVLGSSCVNVMYFGRVNLPSFAATCSRSSSASSGEPIAVALERDERVDRLTGDLVELAADGRFGDVRDDRRARSRPRSSRCGGR